MNIFVLSRNVKTCARLHCDQHVVKMPLETAQLLSTALHCADRVSWSALHADGLAYKPTHLNHPCAIWTHGCINNYLWLAALGLELCSEYDYRFGASKGHEHKCRAVLNALKSHAPLLSRRRTITPFALVVPEDCILPGDPVNTYRKYYREHKAAFARWTGRDVPEWMT